MSYFEHPEYWENLSYIDRIERLYAVCLSTFSLLETLCNDTLPFVQPDNATIELYSRLWGVTFQALSDEEARKLAIPSLTQYPDLRDKKNDLLRHWFDFKPRFKIFVNRLKAELIRLKFNPDNIALIQKNEILFRVASDHIRMYTREKNSMKRWSERNLKKRINVEQYPSSYFFDKKSNTYITGDDTHVLHFHGKSTQAKIVMELDKVKGRYLSTEEISYSTRVQKEDVRHAIAVLRQRIKSNKELNSRLRIDSHKGDGYKLKLLIFSK
jgi:hypothetical protein